MARKCFDLIDKDGSGTLEKPEIVQAVRLDQLANEASNAARTFNLPRTRNLRRISVGGAQGGAESTYRRVRHTHTKEQPVVAIAPFTKKLSILSS